MTVGYLGAGKCWPTESEAIDAVYSSGNHANIGSVTQSTVSYWYFIEKEGGVWKHKLTGIATGSGAQSVYWTRDAPTNVTGTCTLETSGGLPADFDYTILGALFAFSFSVVVGLYLFGKSAGSVVNIFKPK